MLKRKKRAHSGDNQIKNFLLRKRRMKFREQKPEPVLDAIKLDTLHGIVLNQPRQNREFLEN